MQEQLHREKSLMREQLHRKDYLIREQISLLKSYPFISTCIGYC